MDGGVMKDWLIKILGGFTLDELQDSNRRVQVSSGKLGYTKGYSAGLVAGKNEELKNKTKSYSWLKSEIHRKLDLMFPGKEFDKARFRWLKEYTTTSHISDMNFEELKRINELLGGL